MKRAVATVPSPRFSTAASPLPRVPTTVCQAVEIPPVPSDLHEEAEASATLTASEPVLKGIWTRYQASQKLKAPGPAVDGGPPEPAASQVSIQVEDLVSDTKVFIQSLEQALAYVGRARRQRSSYWRRTASDGAGESDDVVHSVYLNLARVFLTISEDRIASRVLTRLTEHYSQVVLDTLQLVCAILSSMPPLIRL